MNDVRCIAQFPSALPADETRGWQRPSSVASHRGEVTCCERGKTVFALATWFHRKVAKQQPTNVVVIAVEVDPLHGEPIESDARHFLRLSHADGDLSAKSSLFSVFRRWGESQACDPSAAMQ